MRNLRVKNILPLGQDRMGALVGKSGLGSQLSGLCFSHPTAQPDDHDDCDAAAADPALPVRQALCSML